MDVERVAAERLLHRGLGHVEFYDLPVEEVEDMSGLIDAFAAEGRSSFSLHAPVGRGGDFPWTGVTCFYLCEDPDRRALSFLTLGHALDAARRWGASHVVTHLTYGGHDSRDAATAERLAHEACARLAEMSREAGVPVDIEFAAYTDSFHEPGQFLDAIDAHPELGICVDVGHAGLGAMLRRRNFLDDIGALSARARSVHLWNTLGMEHTKEYHHTPLHPSQKSVGGWLDIEGAVRTVLDHAPDCFIVFEYPIEEVTSIIQEGYDWIAAIADAYRPSPKTSFPKTNS